MQPEGGRQCATFCELVRHHSRPHQHRPSCVEGSSCWPPNIKRCATHSTTLEATEHTAQLVPSAGKVDLKKKKKS